MSNSSYPTTYPARLLEVRENDIVMQTIKGDMCVIVPKPEGYARPSNDIAILEFNGETWGISGKYGKKQKVRASKA